jgi:hypothetical protein
MYKSFGDHTTSGGTAEGLFNEDGTPQARKLEALTRTYVTAFQGTPHQMYFNSVDASFTASWFIDASVKANTEVYLNPDIHYPNGHTVAIEIDGEAATGVSVLPGHGNYIQIVFDDPLKLNSLNGKTMSITITAN